MKVVIGFLGMGVTTGVDAVKAETMFKAVEDCMDKNELSWNNLVGFSVDNTSGNLGRLNSIKARVLKKNPHCYFLGCPCHIP